MTSIKKILKNCLPMIITNHFRLLNLLHWLKFKIVVIPKLKKQLSTRIKFDFTLVENIKNKKILLPLIETNHYQIYQLLILVKMLKLRGAKVKILVCGQSLSGCEIKSIKNKKDSDPCWKCRFTEKEVLPLFDLDIIKISDVITNTQIVSFEQDARKLISSDNEVYYRGFSLKQSIEDSVVRYFYGAIPDDYSYINNVKVAHARTALMSLEMAYQIDNTWGPDLVISNMPCFSAWEPYYKYYRLNRNRFRQISMTAFSFNSIIFNSFELFPSKERFANYLTIRKNKLNKIEIDELNKFMLTRRLGKADLFVENKYFINNSKTTEVKKLIKYDSSKRNIFLFSNLYWDTGLSERGGLYPDVIDWVIGTIEAIKNESNCHLYIKPHPAENFGSSGSLKGVAQHIRDKYADELQNVTIINPSLRINTYQLFPLVDVGVIFTGTLGLELMLEGKPVISTGITSHSGLNLSEEPSTFEEYKEYLIGNREFKKISKDKIELFAYFYFIRTLIPWRLTKQAYADDFDGFQIKTLADLEVGKDLTNDYLCNCIVDQNKFIPENWPM
jgi:hypothetical protein